ncbi:MAG: HPF/RaiA family ribosome-associated protein [Bdellovibrionales bacterium]
MKFPLQVQFRGMAESDFVYNDIWDHAEKLEKFFDRIVSCHVVVSAPHRHRHQGKIYHLQIRIHVPDGNLFVTTEPEKNNAHEDVYVAIRDAFDSVRRQLEDYIRRKRGFVKANERESVGKVEKLFPNEDYGFIVTRDNRELYFHKNSVLNQEFGQLRVGDEVRFSEEMGEKGPQVTSMTCVGHS